MEEKAWYNSPTNRFLSLRMAVPYSQIVIGSSPVKGMTLGTAQQFDAFINLTEDPLYSKSLEKPREKIRYYWIPINKIGAWEYLPFYKSKQILDFHYEKGDSVYLHCENGINRSPSIAIGWLLSRGHDLKEAALIVSENDKILAEVNQFI